MGKNNRKLKILCIQAYQCHIYGSIGCTYQQLKYSSPNRSKTTQVLKYGLTGIVAEGTIQNGAQLCSS